jgi:large subunit ribosomal protein L21
MYAVVRTGGKQYKVAKDTVLKVESLTGDVGSKLDLEVLMLGGDKPKIGSPLVKGASVSARSSITARARRSSPSKRSAARIPIASAGTASTSPR